MDSFQGIRASGGDEVTIGHFDNESKQNQSTCFGAVGALNRKTFALHITYFICICVNSHDQLPHEAFGILQAFISTAESQTQEFRTQSVIVS